MPGSRPIVPLLVCAALICGGTARAADATPATSADATATAPTGTATPAAPTIPRDPVISPFGIGSSAQRSKDQPNWMPQMAAIGLRDMRACYGGWGIEPTEGAFDYTVLDERLTYLESIGVSGGVIVNGVPKWDTKDKPGYLPLNNLDAWGTMITALAKHTAGRLTHMEVWNEPPNGTHNSTGEDYAKVVVAAYDAAKAGNPGLLVGMAAKSAHIHYLDTAIKAGAKDHFDYLTFHPYELLGTVMAHPGTEPVFMAIVPTVRKMLAAQDPAKLDCPVWFTEIGFDAKRGADKQAQAVIKAYVMGIADGIECIEWFEGMDGDSGPMGLLDGKAQPRPAYAALGKLIEVLGRHPVYLGWVLFNDRHFGFVFQGAKGPVLATWAATTAPDDVDFGAQVTVIDPPTGNTSQTQKVSLTVAPILVTGIPDSLIATAKADKDKPFPWGGDYTSATSVSVTMGETNIEKGLHTMAADTIAKDVIAYGGGARAGTVPGGNVFMVDPNFLAYNTVPIEITAMVRRNEKNDPAKLTLEYESTQDSNYKKAETIDIPDNKDWHKLTWKIDDDRFVGTWAYNFKFNPGKYYIQSVTVTKVAK
jgi:hypothetical protein